MSSDILYVTARACIDILGQPKNNFQRSQFISDLSSGKVQVVKDVLAELEAAAPLTYSDIKSLEIDSQELELKHLSEAARLGENLKGPFGHPPSDRQADLMALALASVQSGRILMTVKDKKRLKKALDGTGHLVIDDYPEENHDL